MRFFWLFGALLWAAGCSHFPSVPSDAMLARAENTFNAEVFSKGGKAVAVIEAENDIPSRYDLHAVLTFRNERTGETFDISVRNGRETVMLSPGDYTLEGFRIVGRERGAYTSIDFGKRYDASFSLEAGEVVYLGKVKTHAVLGKVVSRFFDDYTRELRSASTVTDELKDMSPNYARLIEFHTGKKPSAKLMKWKPSPIFKNKEPSE